MRLFTSSHKPWPDLPLFAARLWAMKHDAVDGLISPRFVVHSLCEWSRSCIFLLYNLLELNC